MSVLSYKIVLGWGGGSAVKTLTAHSQDLGFIFQPHAADSSQSSIPPVLGESNASSDLRGFLHVYNAYIYTLGTHV